VYGYCPWAGLFLSICPADESLVMPTFLDPAGLCAYFEVIMINLILSGDNVIVIGMAAAGLVSELRGRLRSASRPLRSSAIDMI
jgi:hypothetical protein